MLILKRIFNLAAVAAFVMMCLELATPGRGDIGLYYCVAAVFFAVIALWLDDCHHDKQTMDFPYVHKD
jgi:hypothetical protein